MICAFDIGTTTLKGGLIDQTGALTAWARRTLTAHGSPNISSPSLSPARWREAFVHVSRRLIHEYNQKKIKAPIEGIVISGNGPTFVPVDCHGKPVCDAISWADTRSREYITPLRKMGEDKVDPSFYLAKAWMLFKQEPTLYEKIRWFLPCPEYISFFLTGNPYAFLPTPGFRAYMWTDDTIKKAGMERDKFPPFIQTGGEIGNVEKAASSETGIPAGTPVFAGGPDFIMSLLGTDTMAPGRICNRTGTSEGVNLCSREPGDHDYLTSTPHIRKGLYNISCILPFSGKILDWFIDLSGKTPAAYPQLYATLSRILPGSGGLLFLPHVGQTKTSIWPGYRKGIFTGITLEHTKEHFFKAIIEGLGYAVREITEIFENQGWKTEEIRVSGIQASYDVWNKLRADILGKRILVPVIKDTELTGCACIGFTACGYFRNFQDASKKLFRVEKIIEPDPERSRIYTGMYDMYKTMYMQTDPVFKYCGQNY